jgi:hypothetical protein
MCVRGSSSSSSSSSSSRWRGDASSWQHWRRAKQQLQQQTRAPNCTTPGATLTHTTHTHTRHIHTHTHTTHTHTTHTAATHLSLACLCLHVWVWLLLSCSQLGLNVVRLADGAAIARGLRVWRHDSARARTRVAGQQHDCCQSSSHHPVHLSRGPLVASPPPPPPATPHTHTPARPRQTSAVTHRHAPTPGRRRGTAGQRRRRTQSCPAPRHPVCARVCVRVCACVCECV